MTQDTTSPPPGDQRFPGEGARAVPSGPGGGQSSEQIGEQGGARVTPNAASEPHPVVTAAVATLADLGELSVGEHVARYDAVHAALQEALTSIDGV